MAEVTYYMDDETVVTLSDEEDADADGATDRKGWDGTVKGGSKTEAAKDNSSATQKSSVQDHNSSRSNKSSNIADNNSGDGTSQKSIVNTTKSNTKDFLVALDELDEMLASDKTTSASTIRVVKENSRVLRSSINEKENSLGNTTDMEKAATAAETNFAVLLGSINKLGPGYRSISNVLKTKHDTAKNSVSNIR